MGDGGRMSVPHQAFPMFFLKQRSAYVKRVSYSFIRFMLYKLGITS
jgi:hypothetical protein